MRSGGEVNEVWNGNRWSQWIKQDDRSRSFLCHLPPLFILWRNYCSHIFPRNASRHVWHHDGRRAWRLQCVYQRGVSLVWHRAIEHTHTHRHWGPCERWMSQRGLPQRPGNRFASLCLPSTLLKRPRSKALWEAAPSSSGGGHRRLMRWRIPTKRVRLKPHPVHHLFHRPRLHSESSSSSSIALSALPLLAVGVKQCDVMEMQTQPWMNICTVTAHPGEVSERGIQRRGRFIVPRRETWDVLLNLMLAYKKKEVESQIQLWESVFAVRLILFFDSRLL